ncbi:DUF5808 domain-containing protein [Promicromonospora panici]|uniref:DUF5808 domain-containing protein n=1 Tax=Promicromonospora panici TaxID=2219658 RepID=UPI001F5D0632|nr:DUF5808 domain-containing protein [Promicromonospora panici]
MTRKKHTAHAGKSKHGSSKHEGSKRGGGGLKKLITLVTLALTAAAVVKELRTPEAERTWHGKIASVVPYEFRIPTLQRVRERLWDPEAEHVVGPRVFGVGWTVNMGKVVAMVREKAGV